MDTVLTNIRDGHVRRNLIPATVPPVEAAPAAQRPRPRPVFGKFSSSIDPDAPVSLQSAPLG